MAFATVADDHWRLSFFYMIINLYYIQSLQDINKISVVTLLDGVKLYLHWIVAPGKL